MTCPRTHADRHENPLRHSPAKPEPGFDFRLSAECYRATRSRPGFTLLELIVASAIGMLVMGLAISAYRHTQKVTARSEALLRLHRTAGDIGELWEADANTLVHHSACNVTTSTTSGAVSLVQFTGLHGTVHGFDNQIFDLPRDTDLAWYRWEWRAHERRLTRAETPPPQWKPNAFARSPAFMEGNPSLPVHGMRPNAVRTYQEFLSGWKEWPDPLSPDPSAMRRTRIYDLLFLTGKDVDGTSIYAGLEGERTPNSLSQTLNGKIASLPPATALTVPDPRRTMAEEVIDCAITVVARDGSEFTNQSIDGQLQSGSGASLRSRPSVLRLTFTLVDRKTGISQPFTFSAKAP